MKKPLLLIMAGILISACVQPTKSSDNKAPAEVKMNQDTRATAPANLFTLTDAEKIVGEPAHLSDSSTTTTTDVLTYHCAYTANSKDMKSGKMGIIYFLFEHYNRVASAQKKYTFIKTANENHGIKLLDNLGDEAYFHSDGENFYFIMVRKGMKVFNMKVNKITSSTSLDEFNMIAKKITDAL